MKRLLAIVILVACVQTVMAQFCALSGQIKGSEKPVVSLRLLKGGYYPLQRQILEVAADGSFSAPVPVTRPLFALLTCNDIQYRLLLSPGRDVHVFLNNGTVRPVTFNGKGAPENQLLQDLNEDDLVFFMRHDHGKKENPYALFRLDSFRTKVLRPLQTLLDEKQTRVSASAIPPALKELLRSELKYRAQSSLGDFTSGSAYAARNPDSDTIRQLVMRLFPIPDSVSLVSGYFANAMASQYCRNEINRLGKDFRTNPETAKARISAALGVPFDDIGRLIDRYGETYVVEWLYARRFLPGNIRDKVLYNSMMEACDASNLSAVAYLRDTMRVYFPESPYGREAILAAGEIGKMYQAARKNGSIVFHDTTKPASLQALLAKYRGKPVYLDIWGTWCGPCKFELSYAREMKKAFPPGEVLFVYLAMDADSKEQTWKEMVCINGLEGEHYRLTREQIQPLWKEIRSAGGEINRYPTYVLFDRDGKIVHANAARPSDGDNTVRQIKAVMSK